MATGPIFNVSKIFFTSDPVKTITPEIRADYQYAQKELAALETKRQQLSQIVVEKKPIVEIVDTAAFMKPSDSYLSKVDYSAMDKTKTTLLIEGFSTNNDHINNYVQDLLKEKRLYSDAKILNIQHTNNLYTFRIQAICN